MSRHATGQGSVPPVPEAELGWADRPRNQRVIRIALYVLCALLLIAEPLVHRHAYNAVEALPCFYALYGFAALWVAVAIAKVLRRLVGRREDTYGA